MALSLYDDKGTGSGGGSTPTEKVGQGAYNTKTGTTQGKFGQFKTNDMAFLLQAAMKDPDYAAQILRLAQGQTGRPLGRFAGARDSLYGRALQSALSLGGLPGMGDIEGIANDFLTQGVQGNDLMGYSNKLGQRAAGIDFTGISSPQMEDILRQGLALQGLSMGGLGGAVNSGYLDDLIWKDQARNFADSGNDQTNFADLLNGSRYKQAMSGIGR